MTPSVFSSPVNSTPISSLCDLRKPQNRRWFAPFLILTSFCLIFCSVALAQGTRADYERSLAVERLTAGKTFRDRLVPHWLPGGDAFWYQNVLPGKQREYVLVDA